MKVKLQLASRNDLPAYNPILPPTAITQIMLVANPTQVSSTFRSKSFWPMRGLTLCCFSRSKSSWNTRSPTIWTTRQWTKKRKSKACQRWLRANLRVLIFPCGQTTFCKVLNNSKIKNWKKDFFFYFHDRKRWLIILHVPLFFFLANFIIRFFFAVI